MTASAPGCTRPLIVFVHRGEAPIRGSERCLLDLLAGLDRSRFRTLLVCNAPALARAAESLGTETVRQPKWHGSPLTLAPVRRWMRELLHDRGAALVHANMPGVLRVVQPAAWAVQVPVLAHLHLRYASFDPRFRSMIRDAALAVGVSETVVAGLPSVSTPRAVVYNGIDRARLDVGDARSLRALLGIPASSFVLASVGALIHWKGHDVTIAAVADLAARGVDAHLLLCGSGECEAALRAQCDALGVAHRVHFIGFRDDVGAILRDAADVVVSSSREEALGLNLLEAQALGVPVVASDLPAHRESVDDGRTGVLAPVDDPRALAGALAELAAAPGVRAQMGDAARRFVAERFAMRRYVESFEALYAGLLTADRAAFGGSRVAFASRSLGRWARDTVAIRRAR